MMTSNALDSMIEENSVTSRVAEFYAGKSVFITGGTGFLGKVFVEKLLYSCSDIDKIYLLIRNKKGVQANQRLENLFEKPLFSRIKKDKPKVLNKVIPISGDLTAPNLGIDPGDEQVLIREVSVVIHSAATIKFNEQLDIALKVNVDGTRNILRLAQSMKNIQAFVYVSTAYLHTEDTVLDEMAYPAPVDLAEAYKFAEQHHIKEGNEAEMTKFLRGHPNTYTFTKALAEHYVTENHKDLPVIIIRPSIVSAVYNEPLPGWLDNWSGGTAIISGIAKGLVRVLYAKEDVVLDLIPLEYVANLTIVAAASCTRCNQIKFYNCCTSWSNPITIGALVKRIINYASKQDKETHASLHICKTRIFRYAPSLYFTQQKWILISLTFLLQTFPAYIADLWLRITGQRARLAKIQSQINGVCKVLEYFTSQTWVMKCENTQKLHSLLPEADQKIFSCDPKSIDWNEYLHKYFEGISKYLLKESK